MSSNESGPNTHPSYLVDNPDLLFNGDYHREGFDLVITGQNGEELVIADYFSFNPPPNLMLANGNGMSPAMVRSLLHDVFDGALYAGPAGGEALISIGKITLLRGKVFRVNAEGETELHKGDTIYKGDELRVDGRGYVFAKMTDGTRFSLGSNAAAVLDNFEFDAAAKVGKFAATIIKGGFHYKSGGIGKLGNLGNHSEISTPSAVIGIRGSELDGNVDSKGQTTIIHKSGVLTVSDVNGNNAVTLDIPGNTSTIVLNGNPQFTSTASPAQTTAVQQSLPPATTIQQDADNNAGEDPVADGDKDTSAAGDDGGTQGGDDAANDESSNDDANNDDADGNEDGAEGGDEDSSEDDKSEEDADKKDNGDDAKDGDAKDGDAKDGDPKVGDNPDAGTQADGGDGNDADAGDPNTSGTEGGDSETGDPVDSNAKTGGDADGADGTGDNDTAGAGDNDTAGGDGTGGGADGGDRGDGGNSGGGDDASVGDLNQLTQNNPSGAGNTGDGGEDGNTGDGANASGSDGGSNNSGADGSTDGGTDGSAQSGSTNSGSSNTGTSSTGTGSSGTSGSGNSDSGAPATAGSDAGTQPSTGTTEPPPPPPTAVEIPPDNPPVALNDNIAINGTAATEIGSTLLANDSDPDQNQNPTLVAINGGGVNGTLTFDSASQSVLYTPNAATIAPFGQGQTITETFSYQIQSGTLTDTAQVTITLSGSNDAPSANNDNYTIDENSILTVDAATGLLSNDSDPDNGDSISITGANIVSTDQAPVVIQADGSFTFITTSSPTLDALKDGETFTAEFNYTITDAFGATASATATITVRGQNDAPVANTDIASADEGGSITITPLTNDTDIEGDTLIITNITNPAQGSATLSADGLTIIYTAPENIDTGNTIEEVISYTISDGKASSTSSVTVTVTGTNEAPVVTPNAAAATPIDASSGPVTLDVLSSITDDGEGLVITQVIGDSTKGTVELGSVIYDPNGQFGFLREGETDTDSFGFVVTDAEGLTATGTFTVTITGIEDAPTIDGPLSVTVSQDASSGTLDLLSGAVDVDLGDTLTVTNVALPASAILGVGLSIAGNTLTIDPSAFDNLGEGETQNISFTYDVTDSTDLSVSQNATITITGVNDSPIVDAALSVQANQSDPSSSLDLLLGASDADGDTLAVSNVTFNGLTNPGPDSGLSLTGTTLNIDPAVYSSLNVNDNEIIVVNYSIDDGNGGSVIQSTTVTIIGTNNNPVVGAPPSLAVIQNDGISSLDLRLGSIDADGDILSATSITAVAGDNTGITVTGNSLTIDPSFYKSLAANTTETVSYTFDISDGKGDLIPQTASVVITGVNDAPIAVADTAAVAADASTSFNILSNDSDIDTGDTLVIGSINGSPTFTSTVLSSGALLNVTANGDVTYNPNGAFDVLASGAIATDVVSYEVSDGQGGLTSSTFTITVSGVNSNPIAGAPPSLTVNQGSPASSLDLLLGSSDPDGDPLSATTIIATTGNDGGISISGNTLSITPSFYTFLAAGVTETVTYSYNIDDGAGGVVPQTASVVIAGLNDPVIAVDDIFTVPESGSFTGNVLANNGNGADSDIDNDPITVVPGLVSSSSAVEFSLASDGSFTYFAPIGPTTTDTFTYTAQDGNGSTSTGFVTINITPVNDAPVINFAPSFSTNEDTPFVIPFSVTDPDVLDGNGQSTVTVTLTGGTLQFFSSNLIPLTINSGGDGQSSISLTGLLSDINVAASSLQFIPDPDANGPGQIDLTVDDLGNTGSPGPLTDAVSIPVTITPVNDAPFKISGYSPVSTNNDTVNELIDLSIDVDDVDIVTDGDTLNFTLISNTNPTLFTSATLSGATGPFTNQDLLLDFAPGLTGTATLTIQITDIAGATTTDTISVTVSPNSPPSPGLDNFAIVEDTPFINTLGVDDLLINDFDPDGDSLSVITTPLVDASNGSLSLNADGTFTYAPFGDFNGVDTFKYQVTDGVNTATSTVTLTVSAVNDNPFANNDAYSIPEDGSLTTILSSDDLLLNDVDIDGDTLSLNTSALVGVSNGILILSADGTFTYTPTANFSGNDSFQYQVLDGNGGVDTATATISVTPVNDPPVTVPDNYVTTEDTPFSPTLGVDDLLFNDSDVDLDTLTVNVSPITPPTNGAVTLNTNGTFTYTPNLNYNGTDTFQYSVTDGNGGTVTSTATIIVSAVNDAPALVPKSYTFVEDTTITTTLGVDDLLQSQTDAEGDTLSIVTTPLVDVSNGSLTINADASFTYIPNPDFAGTDSFSFQVSDGNGGTSTSTTTLTVTPVNDAPIAVGDIYNLLVDSSITTTIGIDDLLLNDSDVDFDSLVVTTNPAPTVSSGSITVNSDGTFTYTPNGGFIGTDFFVYKITDGGGLTSTGTVTLNVDPLPVNTALANDVYSNPSNWSLGNIPIGGDSVLIPNGVALTASSETFNYADFILDGTLTSTSGAFAGPGALLVNGTLEVRNTGNTISNQFDLAVGSNLLIDADNSTSGQLTISNSLLNDGTITIDQSSTSNNNSTLTVSGILTNNGLLSTIDTNGGLTFPHDISATINNNGTIDIGQDTRIINAGKVFDSSGPSTLQVQAGQTLNVENGTLSIGTMTSLSGTGTIALTGISTLDVASAITISTGAPVFDFSGSNVTISGAGQLTVDAANQLTLDSADDVQIPLIVNGDLIVRNAVNSISGGLTNIGGSTLLVDADNGVTGQLTVGTSFTNNGDITIDHSSTSNNNSILTISGTLTNAGTITTQDTNGGLTFAHDIQGSITNTGTININQDTRIVNAGSIFDSSAVSTVQVASGKVLTIQNGTTVFGTNTVLSGTGTIAFSGTNTLSLTTDFTIDASQATLDFSGSNVTISGVGQLLVNPLATLTLDSAEDVQTNLVNNGAIIVRNAANQFSGGYAGTANSDLTIDGDAGTSGQLTIATGFSNNGTITIDHSAASNNASTLTITSGVLANIGTLVTQDTNGGLLSPHSILANLNNSGDVDIKTNTILNKAGAAHTNSGSILIDPGMTLTVTGTSLTNETGGFIEGGGTLDITAAPFSNNGLLIPGGEANVDTLSVIGNLQQSASAVLLIDVATSASADLLSVNGVYTYDGTLDLNFMPGNGITGGEVIQIVQFTSSAGIGNYGSVSHNLGTGYLVSIVNGSSDISVSITANFTSTFDNGGATGLWGTATNWNPDGLPSSPDNVLITDFLVTHTTTTDVVSSLTLQGTSPGSSTLDLTSGTINTISGSTFFADSVFNLNGGTFQADADLHVNGTFNFLGGTLTGTGFTTVAGSFVASTAATKNIDAALYIKGTGDISNTTISGNVSGLIEVQDSGVLLVNTSAVNVDVNIIGTLQVDGASSFGGTNFLQNGSLIVQTNGTNGAATATIGASGGLLNNKDIILDSIVAAGTATLTVSNATLTNSINGKIISFSSNSSVGVSNTINANVVNNGEIDVLADLTINDSGTFQNTGLIAVTSTTTLTIIASNATNSGSIVLNGVSGVTANSTILDVTGVGTFTNTGIISGIGTVNGTITGNSPSVGASPGHVTITGDFIASASSLLDVELEGEEAGISYDQLDVLGTANLQGSIDVTLLNGYKPVSNTTYAVLTAGILLGSFDEASGLDFSQEEVLDLNYADNTVTLAVVRTTDIGTSEADTIISTADQSIVVAGAGDDNISAFSSGSIIYGQAGNDVITVGPDFKRVDGGDGIDTIVITESTDLTQLQGTQIDRIEVISLDDNNADTIELDSDSISTMVDGINALTGLDSSAVVIGNVGDSVNLYGDFVLSGETLFDAGRGEETFRTFTDGESTLFISDEISLQTTSTNGSEFVFNATVDLPLVGLAADPIEEEIDFGLVSALPSLQETTAPSLLPNTHLQTFDVNEILDPQLNDLSQVINFEALGDGSSAEITDSVLEQATLQDIQDSIDVLDSSYDDGTFDGGENMQFLAYNEMNDINPHL